MKLRSHSCGMMRVLSWVMAVAMVFSLAAVSVAATPGTYSAELVMSREGTDISGKLALDSVQGVLAVLADMRSEGESVMSAAAYASAQALVVDSKLIGGAYGANLTALAENLPGSIFAPGSGSAFALDEETYEQILSLLSGDALENLPAPDAAQNSAMEEAAQVLAEALAEPLSQAAANLATETVAVTETINGAAVDATRMTITADGEAILGFVEPFISTLQSNPEVQQATAAMIDGVAAAGVSLDVSGEEFVQMVLTQGDELLEQMRTELAQSNVVMTCGASLSNATQAPVKLFLELEADGSTLTFNILIGEAMDFFRFEMLEDGQVGPAMQLELRPDETGITVKFALLEGETEDASIALNLNMAQQTFLLSLVASGEETALSGYFTTSENLFSLTVDKLNHEEFGALITLNLRGDDSISLPAFNEITSMSEEEFAALVTQVSQAVESLSQMFA